MYSNLNYNGNESVKGGTKIGKEFSSLTKPDETAKTMDRKTMEEEMDAQRAYIDSALDKELAFQTNEDLISISFRSEPKQKYTKSSQLLLYATYFLHGQ